MKPLLHFKRLTGRAGCLSFGTLVLSFLSLVSLPQAYALGIPAPISDFVVFEDSPATVIDLATVFSDATGYSVFANDNAALVQTTIIGNSLVLDYQENQYGSAFIRITATDGVGTVANSFRVTVIPVNDFPTTTPADFSILTTPASTPVLFTFTVHDVEDDAASPPIPLTVTASVFPPAELIASVLVSVSGSERKLEITPAPGADGEATIRIQVSDSMGAVLNKLLTLRVTSDGNHPPAAVANIFPDADLDDGDPGIIVISANGVDAPVTLDGTMSFDPDGDLLTFSWFVSDSVSLRLISSSPLAPYRVGVGDLEFFLSVSDGSLASPYDHKSVLVISIDEAVELLVAKVNNSSLSRYWKPTLAGYLRATIRAFHSRPRPRGPSPCEAGLDGLRFFRLLVIALSSGRTPVMSSDLATELNYLTDEIINNVQCE